MTAQWSVDGMGGGRRGQSSEHQPALSCGSLAVLSAGAVPTYPPADCNSTELQAKMLRSLLAVAAVAAAAVAQGNIPFGQNAGDGGHSALQGSSGGGFGGGQLEAECECVPYYQCANGTIIKNGVGLIDIRQQPDGPCDNYLDVCCTPPDRIPLKPTSTASPFPDPGPGTPPRTREGGCGARHPEGVGFRITGAENNEAQFGEFPWMVAVLHEEAVGQDPNEKVNVYKCGGALIHPQVVLTAAHCVHDSQSGLKVRAGEWDTQTKNEVLPHQDRSVAKVLVHPDFKSDSLYNDVALLFLDAAMELAENVDVVCLPSPGHVVESRDCLASGWGKDVFGKEGHYQVILKRVELPLVPHAECQGRLRKTRLGNYFELHDSFVCAGGVPGMDTCRGDGGSPLVCPLAHDRARYQAVGLVAWGIGCGDDIPAVYANVAHGREWIDRNVAAEGFDPKYYTY